MASQEGSKHIPKSVLAMLGTTTHISDPEVWSNIFSLVGKCEHDDIRWWRSSDGGSVYTFVKRLPYDYKDRGTTVGLVGFTTHASGKPSGDAMELFECYAKMGGRDFRALGRDAKSEDGSKALQRAIDAVGDDPKWMLAQWTQLFSSNGSGYIREAQQICKKRGIDRPSALTFAAIFDCALNHGATGKGGARDIADRVPKSCDTEMKFLEKFLEIRKPIASDGNAYNDPPINGVRRCEQFMTLLHKKCMGLKGCDAEIRQATSWEMK